MTKRLHTPRGFTLIEILATMAILVFGLAGVLSIIYTGMKQNDTAADRDAAAMIIPQAIEIIKLQHLITSDTFGASPAHIGSYIETLDNSETGDVGAYSGVTVGKSPGTQLAQTGPLSYLPTNPNEIFPVGNLVTFNPGTEDYSNSSTYRVRYRLEKHHDWWPHDDSGNYSNPDEDPNSPFVGVYVLTLAVYKGGPGNTQNDRQVCDPIIVYLYDKLTRD